MGAQQILRTVFVVAGLSALFLANAAWRIGASTPEQLFLYWRSSDDFAIAAGYAARHEFPVAPFRVKDTVRREKDPRFVAYRERLAQELAERQIQPMTFWRTLPPSSIAPDRQWRAAERFDDGGRALLLGLCYRALGGAAPFFSSGSASCWPCPFSPPSSWSAVPPATPGPARCSSPL